MRQSAVTMGQWIGQWLGRNPFGTGLGRQKPKIALGFN